MSEWRPIAVNQKMFQNVAETSLQKAAAALENIYINDAGGHTRFPGLKPFLQIPGETGTMFVVDYKSDLIAVSSTGRTYRIDDRSNAESVTDVQLSGGLRPVFTKTEDELVYAAGGPILRFAGKKTELLSNDAPIATHVAYADGYLVANERSSGRFQYSDAGLWRTWDPLNILTAESNPPVLSAVGGGRRPGPALHDGSGRQWALVRQLRLRVCAIERPDRAPPLGRHPAEARQHHELE